MSVFHTIDEGVGEEKEKIFGSENLQEMDKEDSTEDKEDLTQDKEKEKGENPLEEEIIERGRKRLKSPL